MKKVYATFRGYAGTLNGNRAKYVDDEWLCDLYSTEAEARYALRVFGEGKPFDSNLENKITRFYEQGPTIFQHGMETDSLTKGGYIEWMRYEELEVKETVPEPSYQL